MKKLFIDIGGTRLRAHLVDDEGTEEHEVSSREIGLYRFIEEQMQCEPEISFIGVSYAGQVHNGHIIASPNIRIDEAAIQSRVQSRFGIPLEIENDLNCAVMAEAQFLHSDQVAALYVGTGIGAAVIDRGRLVRGENNMAFELGHIPYKPAPFACGCGRKNCLELFVSGSALAKWLEYYGHEDAPDLVELGKSDIDHLNKVKTEFEYALLHAAGTLLTMANPRYLVLGGGVIQANPHLFAMLYEKISNFALKPSLQGAKIVLSELPNASMEGAKLLEKRLYG